MKTTLDALRPGGPEKLIHVPECQAAADHQASKEVILEKRRMNDASSARQVREHGG